MLYAAPREAAAELAAADRGLPDGAPARIVYPGARADGSDVEVSIHADDVYAHWVVYVPVRRTYFAVEPATNANGGFALADNEAGPGFDAATRRALGLR